MTKSKKVEPKKEVKMKQAKPDHSIEFGALCDASDPSLCSSNCKYLQDAPGTFACELFDQFLGVVKKTARRCPICMRYGKIK